LDGTLFRSKTFRAVERVRARASKISSASGSYQLRNLSYELFVTFLRGASVSSNQRPHVV